MLRRRNEQSFDSDFSYSKLSSNSPFKVSVHSVSTLFAVVVIVGGLLLFDGIVKIAKHVPKPLKTEDEINNPKSFIAERAQIHLKQLTSLGPKVTGSYENEVLAVDYLKREISFIIQQANKNQQIELDVQKVSGAYYLDFKPFGLVNVYENVQNVVARVASEHNSNHSLLINCHFDSVPTSPGASDDGINCAAMLETLRILSREPRRPLHNIVFLFNGAEENPLQAAHGFITQHRWAGEVSAVVNLEAAGSGGRELLFQAGPGNMFLIDAYKSSAPHPHGQSIGQAIFESNLIPSDTDFRVFRDFGRVPGLDFAFARNGYVYHTRHDGFDIIPAGSYQHLGDNLLALVRTLSSSRHLPAAHLGSRERYVYFDVLGRFMFLYTEATAVVVNCTVAVMSLVLMLKKMAGFPGSFSEFILYTFLSGLSQIVGWAVSVVFSAALAFFLDYFNLTMSWYATPRVIFGLYFCPALAISIFCINLLNKADVLRSSLSLGNQTQMHLHVLRVVWTALLLLSTIYLISASYVFLIPVIFNLITFVAIDVFKVGHTRRVWLFIYLANTLAQTVISMYLIENLFAIFIPITGRFGSNKNPELYIGALSMLAYILITCFYIPLITLVRKPLTVAVGLFAIFAVTLSLVAFTSYGFPYSDDASSPAPQRYWIFHTARHIHDESGALKKQDSGYFFLNMDRNSPRMAKDFLPELKNAISLEKDCESIIYCGLPIYTSRMLAIHEDSTWIPAAPPVIHEEVKLQLVSKEENGPHLTRYNFQLKGPDHASLFISPKDNIEILKWSFIDSVPEVTYKWNGRPTYFIMYGYGQNPNGYNFWVDVKHPEGWNKLVMDFAVSGKYIHHDNYQTADYKQFLNKFPSWTHVTPWFANFYSWIF